jgi:hypothetical protein
MRLVRWIAVAAVLGLTACGSGTQPTTDEVSSGPSTVTEPSDPGRGETTVDLPTAPTVAGPGLLDLLERTEGRLELHRQGGTPSIEPSSSADFFAGGHRLRVDEHPDFRSTLADYQASLAERNEGVEPWAQVTLPGTDPLVHRAALVDLVAGIYLADSAMFGMAGDECTQALDEVRQQFVATEPPPPSWEPQADGTEHWDYPTHTIPHHPECVAEIFDADDLDPASTALRLRRHVGSGTLEVLFDPGHYTDATFEPILLVSVTGDAPRGDPPPEPLSTVFDQVSVFLLAINGCGELPWAYSNFMAGDSYTPPTARDYLEPGPFTGGYVCADQVPERR